MPRRLRFHPEGALVEVTCRTVQGRFLLRPTTVAKELILGVVGRAQRLYEVEIVAMTFLSSHYHMLLVPADAQQLAGFVGYVNSNVARKIGRLVGWRERFWGRRYQAIVVSDEESAQVARLRYILENGCKEGFVLHPCDLPGPQSAPALVDGSMTLAGRWRNDTKAYWARQRREELTYDELYEQETISLSPLPCWRHLEAEPYRQRIVDLVTDIESETLRHHQATATAPTGAAFLIERNPHQTPARLARSPAPAFHAASKALRTALRAAYALFYAAFRQAADRLARGELDVVFPIGSFPPARAFVAA